MRVTLFFLIFCAVAASAQSVGGISFDANTDDPAFKLCNPDNVLQIYHLKTNMDETPIMVEKEFRAKFKSQDAWKNENALIRIRFVVNCSGTADRFRLLTLSPDLKEQPINKDLEAHILSIAKSISWPARRAWQQTVDYYQHFSVWIVNGELSDIVQ